MNRHPWRAARAAALALALLATASPLGAAAPAPAAEPSAAGLAARLDALFAAAYPADQPGAAVLVQRGDEVLLRRGYGMADLEMGVAIDPTMVFRLGSVTKQFTAAAVLRLAGEGKLALADPIGRHLPGYPEAQAGVTIEQLLTHTGGIPSYSSFPEFWLTKSLDHTVDEMIATWRDRPLDFAPGTRWTYSNSGYFLLGALIEKVSGKSYEAYVEEEVMAPLGLARTGYDRSEEVLPGRVEGYAGNAETGYRNADYLSMTGPYAAGALYSNVDDLARWAQALAAGRVTTPADRDRMATAARLADGRSTGYGLGVAILDYQGDRIVHHGGGINGFSTYLGTVPSERIVVAVLSNNPEGGASPEALGSQALALVLGHPLDARPSVELPAETLGEYVGVYQIGDDPETTRTFTVADGRLYSQRAGGGRLPVLFSAADSFFYADSMTTGRFVRDASGAVTGTWFVHASGGEEAATKTDREPAAPRQAIEVDAAARNAVVGRYQIAPGFVLEIRSEGDGLVGQATGQSPFPLAAETPTRWFFEPAGVVIDFHGAEDGRADSLVLHQGGRDTPAPRVE